MNLPHLSRISLVKVLVQAANVMRRELVHADLRNPHYVEWIRFLRQSENWSREKIADYQLGELKRVITYAYEN